jgi:hypothetical protein
MQNVDAMYAAKSMSEAKKKWAPGLNAGSRGCRKKKSSPFSSLSSSSSMSMPATPMMAAAAPQSCHRSVGLIEHEQVSRMMKKCSARKGKAF